MKQLEIIKIDFSFGVGTLDNVNYKLKKIIFLKFV